MVLHISRRHTKIQSFTTITLRNREIGTGILEASNRFLIFSFATQGGKQASSYGRQRNWAREPRGSDGLRSDSLQAGLSSIV